MTKNELLNKFDEFYNELNRLEDDAKQLHTLIKDMREAFEYLPSELKDITDEAEE